MYSKNKFTSDAAKFSAPHYGHLRSISKSGSSRFFGSKANRTEPTYPASVVPNRGRALKIAYSFFRVELSDLFIDSVEVLSLESVKRGVGVVRD